MFKTVQDAVQSAKLAVQDLESEFKKSVCIFFLFYILHKDQLQNKLKEAIIKIYLQIREESSLSSVSARSVVTLTDSLGKCKEKLDVCSCELSKLKSAVYSKEKLVSYVYVFLILSLIFLE